MPIATSATSRRSVLSTPRAGRCSPPRGALREARSVAGGDRDVPGRPTYCRAVAGDLDAARAVRADRRGGLGQNGGGGGAGRVPPPRRGRGGAPPAPRGA